MMIPQLQLKIYTDKGLKFYVFGIRKCDEDKATGDFCFYYYSFEVLKTYRKEFAKLKDTEFAVMGKDTLFIVEDYTGWKVFYVDERGNQEELRFFENEAEACTYVYNELKNNIY